MVGYGKMQKLNFSSSSTRMANLFAASGLAGRLCRCGLLVAFFSGTAEATEVALAGVFPGKALLVVNGGTPRSVGVGSTTPDGVRVISVEGEGATVEFDGRRQRLFVGQHAINVRSAAGGTGGAPSIAIHADGQGQFRSSGAVNGAPLNFIVDTGATYVSLGRSDALKAGVDFTKGEPAMLQTANGLIRAWRVSLDSVRVGEITLRNVDGIVQANDMPIALLGMSFLNRMEMRRDNATLQLRQRY